MESLGIEAAQMEHLNNVEQVVSDNNKFKLKLAKKLGATHSINSTDKNFKSEILNLCNKNGMKTCAVVNVIESSIARISDLVLPIHAGPEIGVASTKAFLGQMLVLYILCLKISSHKIKPFKLHNLIELIISMVAWGYP